MEETLLLQIGSTEWVEHNLVNLGSKAVAHLNVDCAVQGPGFFAGATPQLDNLLVEVTKKVDHVKDPDSKDVSLNERWTTTNKRVNTNSDEFIFLHPKISLGFHDICSVRRSQMDKSWINQHRLHPEYIDGAEEFVKLACQNNPLSNEVTCPCKQCRNVKLVKKDLLGEHLMVNGFLPSYTRRIFHGEDLPASVPLNENVSDSNDGDEVNKMIYEGFGLPPPSLVHLASNETRSSNIELGPDKKTERFFSLLKEAKRELYPACHKFSTLSFVVRLLHIKCLSGWSDKSFTMLLKLLKDAFPKGETLPKSFYATRALLRELGLDYHKVHACPRDCSLYWKETASRDDCIVCQTPRYKQFEGEKNDYKKKQQRIPQKIVRYFPLIPRLQRLFMSSKTTSLMRWHVEGRIDDGKMRHPADYPVWKNFDTLYPKFASKPHNVKLGLAADGFNLFKAMNVAHSSWPVIVMPYNLPPWLCMKQPHMMMILLIDGPSSPGNNIDVYLRLLVDELIELWENGVQTYDTETNQMFQLHAVLL
ncbi:uncharacterized protein LOC114314134 [Camellia sinensis]|uniref:uncharacterized protein LOC114314134 n=1 Tax=Camellia sinensis TaxID=4442 RepID=UPI001036AC09|nr:uncharacterized protein LOC114314134 [Camellia sinensis]